MGRDTKPRRVQDARAHFGEVFNAALKGDPQHVTRRGKDTVVVISEDEWRKLTAAFDREGKSFGEYLASFPLSPEEWAEIAPRRSSMRLNPFVDGES